MSSARFTGPALAWGTSGLGRATAPGSAAEAAAIELAAAMLARDATGVDTSNAYAGGRSEHVLGAALAQLEPRERARAGARIMTKVDADSAGRLDREQVLRCAEASLNRLGIDHLPLLHLHDPYTITLAEAAAPRGAISGLVELREQGIASAIGIAAGPIDLMRDYVATDAFDAVLSHNRFTLVDTSALPLWREARDRGMTTINAAPFGGGLLAKGPRPGATYAYRPASADLLAWVDRVRDVCAVHHVSLPALALQFSLTSQWVDTTVVGASRTAQLAATETLRTTTIPAALRADLAGLGPAPTPHAPAPAPVQGVLR